MIKRLISEDYFVSLNLNYSNNKKELKICGQRCVSYPKLLKASSYIFKQEHKSLSVKNSFNCESNNLISFVIYQECKENMKLNTLLQYISQAIQQ